MYKIVYETHKPLHELMQDEALEPFDAVLDRALAKNPEQRYPSALAMKTALLALATQPVPDLLPAHLVLKPHLDGLDGRPLAPTGHEGSAPPRPSTRSQSAPAGSVTAPSGAARPASGTAPASIPVPTGWDSAALADVERELAQYIGPVARVLVRRAARGVSSLAELRQAVAASIVDVEARERFLSRTAAPRTGGKVPTLPTTAHVTQGVGPASGGVPMREGDVERAAAALLSSLGPIARVVAKRCAADSATREQFVARVLEQLTHSIDARRVEADLWRALG